MQGKVYSSLSHEPIILAAVLVEFDIVSFTDANGVFSLELESRNPNLTLVFQAAKHREVEISLRVHPSISHELTVVLEYIESVEVVQNMQLGFDVVISSSNDIETHGINGLLHFPPGALIHHEMGETYLGAGKILHSLYHSGRWPDISLPALKSLVYEDSKGASFSLQCLVLGSLQAVGENGKTLELQVGAPIVVSVSLRFDANVKKTYIDSLHLFSFSPQTSRWMDRGKMTIVNRDYPEDEGGNFWVTYQGKLRKLDPLWAVGYPLRISCWVKVRVFQGSGQQREVDGVEVNLQQSDDRVGRVTFYQRTTETAVGVGTCLQSVCSLGGVLRASARSSLSLEAVTPRIVNGIIMGTKDQIMIYTIDKQYIGITGRHPFYSSLESCLQNLGARSGHFRFITRSLNTFNQNPSIILTPLSPEATEPAVERYCFLKVAVLDCATYTDVKVISYGEKGEILSMNFEIASTLGGDNSERDTCGKAGLVRLKASCVDYSCGSSVHVTAQSRGRLKSTKLCRYWSSSSAIPWSVPAAHNLTSFQFVDPGTSYDHGIYHSVSRDLALMKCYSGSESEPSNTLDPYRGAAVTFTCLS